MAEARSPDSPPQPPAEPAPWPTHVRYWVMALVCALSFFAYFDRVCIARAQGDIGRDLGLSDEQMGWVFAIFWFAYALFEIPGGWFADRFGPRLALTRIVIWWSAFTALTGSVSSFLPLLVVRFLFGMGEAGAYPSIARIMSVWLPVQERGLFGGLVWLMARWGGAFAPLLFGRLMVLFALARSSPSGRRLPGLAWLAGLGDWRVAFWISGLVGLAWCAIYFPWFRNSPAEQRGVNRAERELIERNRPPEPGPGHAPRVWRALLRSRTLWAMALLYVCCSFSWSFFVSWLPRYLKDVHHVPFQSSEVQAGLPLFFGGVSCLLGGGLSDWLGRRTGSRWLGRALLPMGGYTLAAAALVSVRWVSTPSGAVLLLCIASIGSDLGQAANWATLVDVGQRYAGTATGFINMIGNLGSAISPVVAAWLFTTAGWGTLLGVYAASYLVAAAMWLLIDPTRPFYLPEPPGREGIG